jgi:tetratricopeptide (TPR) repeat protein
MAVRKGEDDYSHVWTFMKAKVAHLGVKPEDPSRLPFEARLMWIEDFHSPDPRIFLYTYATIPLLALMGGLVGFRGVSWKEWGDGKTLFLLLLLAFLSLYLLVQRMTGFVAFFLVVLAAGTLLAKRPAVLLLALLSLSFEAHKSIYYRQPTAFKACVDSLFPPEPPAVPNWHPNNVGVIDWIRHHTRPDEAFLARFGTSPMILAYADRSVVLQSKVENREVREQIRGFLETLYRTEEEFYRYCRENEVRYFLYEAKSALDHSGDSDRYVAEALKLRKDSPAYLFHFRPEKLKHFTLLYQNSFYRIYAVHPEGKRSPSRPLAYQPTYDLRLFGTQEGEFFDDSATPQVMARLAGAVDLFSRAQAFLCAGRVGEALRDMEAAAALNPGVMGLQTTLGLTLSRIGQTEEALPHLRQEVRSFPDFVLGYYNLGYVLANAGRYEEAMQQWQEGLRLDPNHAPILDGLAQVRQILEWKARK